MPCKKLKKVEKKLTEAEGEGEGGREVVGREIQLFPWNKLKTS